MSLKVLYILSKVDKAVAFEWIVESFKNSGIELEFILLNDKAETALSIFLEINSISFYHFNLGTKKNYVSLIVKISKVIRKVKPDVVHSHLLEASFLGLTAAKLVGIKNRFYTRHHSTFQHTYFPHAVKYDKFINLLATKIIAISSNVKNVLIEKEGVSEDKIVLIEHGFKLEAFKNPLKDDVEKLKVKYSIPENKLIIGTISRYIEWKGVEFVIDAFKNFNKINPNSHLLLANAGGSYEKTIKKHLNELPANSYTEITFEPDLYSLYQLIDIYCHTPINKEIEAFGQTYIEALASSVPSIFTLSGIARDFIIHEKNALVVKFKSVKEIERAILKLSENQEMVKTLIEGGLGSIERFELTMMIGGLKELYLSYN